MLPRHVLLACLPQTLVVDTDYSAICYRVSRSLWRLCKRVFVPPVLGVTTGVTIGLLFR